MCEWLAYMSRKALPTLLLGLALVLAGCAGLSAKPGAVPNTSTSPTDTAISTATETPGLYPGHGQVPYELWIANTGNNESYRLTVTFLGPENGSQDGPVLNETFEVEANSSVKQNITFSRSGTYRVEARSESGATATHEYDVAAPNPISAVVIGITTDGELMIATYH